MTEHELYTKNKELSLPEKLELFKKDIGRLSKIMDGLEEEITDIAYDYVHPPWYYPFRNACKVIVEIRLMKVEVKIESKLTIDELKEFCDRTGFTFVRQNNGWTVFKYVFEDYPWARILF